MNNDQNQNELNNTEPISLPDQEESTIFSAPQTKDDYRAKKLPRGTKIALSVISVVLVAAIIVAVSVFIPKLVEPTASEAFSTIPVTKYDSLDVDTITVKNEFGTYKYLSSAEYTELDGQTTRYVSWYMENLSTHLFDKTKLEGFAYTLTNLNAIKELGADTGVYSFDDPLYSVSVTSRDKTFTDFQLLIGSLTPDKNSAYAKLSGSDKVWLIDAATLEDFNKVPTEFASTQVLLAASQTDKDKDYFNEGTLSRCDKIVLNNPNFTAPIVFVENDTERTKTYATYLVTSPVKRYADKTNELLQIASNGLVGDGVYVFNPTADDIKKYRLDKPDATLDIYYSDTVISLKASKFDDQYYALCDQNNQAIYKIYYNSVLWAQNPMNHYFNKFLTMELLTGLNRINVTCEGKDYGFDITYYKELEDGENFDIVLNGTELNQTAFQNYYQVFLSLEVIEYTTKPITSDAVYSFTMKHSDKSLSDTTLTLYKHSDQRYIACVNGEQMGLISSTSYAKLVNYFNMLISGEDVPKS